MFVRCQALRSSVLLSRKMMIKRLQRLRSRQLDVSMSNLWAHYQHRKSALRMDSLVCTLGNSQKNILSQLISCGDGNVNLRHVHFSAQLQAAITYYLLFIVSKGNYPRPKIKWHVSHWTWTAFDAQLLVILEIVLIIIAKSENSMDGFWIKISNAHFVFWANWFHHCTRTGVTLGVLS